MLSTGPTLSLAQLRSLQSSAKRLLLGPAQRAVAFVSSCWRHLQQSQRQHLKWTLLGFKFMCCCAFVAVGRPWTTFLPLGIVLGVAMVKEAVEDYKRHKQDVEVNNRAVEVRTSTAGAVPVACSSPTPVAVTPAQCAVQHSRICSMLHCRWHVIRAAATQHISALALYNPCSICRCCSISCCRLPHLQLTGLSLTEQGIFMQTVQRQNSTARIMQLQVAASTLGAAALSQYNKYFL
jgi:hypothetical protein